MIKVLDHGYVQLVEHWGSDERIIEAARMSTNKGFQGWGPKHHKDCDYWENQAACDCIPNEPGDEKLLRYLWEHKHHTPFEMAGMVIEVQAPIMVFREWMRHRTQSFNEMSGRYTELPDLYYIPSYERVEIGGQSKTNKQASGEKLTHPDRFREAIENNTREARKVYESLLGSGLSKELARLVLPVNQYSRMRASANLRNWLAFLTLRMAPDAQWEIRQFANAVALLVAEKFPRTYGLFEETTGLGPVEYRKAL